MRDAALPAGLVAGALGLALGFVPARLRALGAGLFSGLALSLSSLPLPQSATDGAFLACFACVLAAAAAVVWPHRFAARVRIALAAVAGVAAGIAVAAAGAPADLARSLPFVLLAIPAGGLVSVERAVALKVVASWLVTVSVLAGALTLAPVTPGYVPDHLE